MSGKSKFELMKVVQGIKGIKVTQLKRDSKDKTKREKFEFLRNQFYQAQSNPNWNNFCKVMGIVQTQNRNNISEFKKRIKAKGFNQQNIKILFHGTTKAAVQSILKTGFRQSTGGMLGAGVYFGSDPNKSFQYSLKEKDPNKVFLMFRCLVVLEQGKFKYAKNKIFDEYVVTETKNIVITHVYQVFCTKRDNSKKKVLQIHKGFKPNAYDLYKYCGIGKKPLYMVLMKDKTKCRYYGKCRETGKNYSNHKQKYYHKCKYGMKCREIKNNAHCQNFFHPCRYGNKCRNIKNPIHFACFHKEIEKVHRHRQYNTDKSGNKVHSYTPMIRKKRCPDYYRSCKYLSSKWDHQESQKHKENYYHRCMHWDKCGNENIIHINRYQHPCYIKNCTNSHPNHQICYIHKKRKKKSREESSPKNESLEYPDCSSKDDDDEEIVV